MSKGSLHDEIAEVAYSLYEKRGRKYGHQEEDWFQAEKIVRERRAKDQDGKPAKSSQKRSAGSASAAVKTTTKSSAGRSKKAPSKKKES